MRPCTSKTAPVSSAPIFTPAAAQCSTPPASWPSRCAWRWGVLSSASASIRWISPSRSRRNHGKAEIAEARLAAAAVSPGDAVSVRVLLRPHRQAAEEQVLEVRDPADRCFRPRRGADRQWPICPGMGDGPTPGRVPPPQQRAACPAAQPQRPPRRPGDRAVSPRAGGERRRSRAAGTAAVGSRRVVGRHRKRGALPLSAGGSWRGARFAPAMRWPGNGPCPWRSGGPAAE